MVCIGLHQRFGREQTKVSNKEEGGVEGGESVITIQLCTEYYNILHSLINGYMTLIKREHAVDKLTKAERAS